VRPSIGTIPRRHSPSTAARPYRASHFEHDPSLRFEARVIGKAEEPPSASPVRGTALGAIDFGAAPTAPSAELPVSGGGVMSFTRIGHVELPFRAGTRRLGVYWMAGYAGGLFIPFRDGTSGHETYVAGRYLIDAAKSADLGGDSVARTLILDFNFAYQPSCAFDPKWACPLAPPENRLDIPIRAGERLAPDGEAG
jgi:hypothetical protein